MHQMNKLQSLATVSPLNRIMVEKKTTCYERQLNKRKSLLPKQSLTRNNLSKSILASRNSLEENLSPPLKIDPSRMSKANLLLPPQPEPSNSSPIILPRQTEPDLLIHERRISLLLPNSIHKKQTNKSPTHAEQSGQLLNKSDSSNTPKEDEQSQPRIEQEGDESEKKKSSSISVKTVKKIKILKDAEPYPTTQQPERESPFTNAVKIAQDKLKNPKASKTANNANRKPLMEKPQKELIRLVSVDHEINRFNSGQAPEADYGDNKSALSIVQIGQQHLASGVIDASPFEPFLLKSNTEEKMEKEIKQEKINQYSSDQRLSRYLNFTVSFEGKNLSVEARRCILACRAILARPKVLLSFEDSFDFGKGIENNMRKVSDRLSDATMMTITKDTSNLLFYDRLIFLDAGKLIEKGNPKSLINDQHSYLYRFLREVQSSDLEFLLQRAKSQSIELNRAHPKSDCSETPTIKSNSPAERNSDVSAKNNRGVYKTTGHKSSELNRTTAKLAFRLGIPKSQSSQAEYSSVKPRNNSSHLQVIESEAVESPSPQKNAHFGSDLLPDIDMRLSDSSSNSSGPPRDLPINHKVPNFTSKNLTELSAQTNLARRKPLQQQNRLTSIPETAAWYLRDINGLPQEPRISSPSSLHLRSNEKHKSEISFSRSKLGNPP